VGAEGKPWWNPDDLLGKADSAPGGGERTAGGEKHKRTQKQKHKQKKQDGWPEGFPPPKVTALVAAVGAAMGMLTWIAVRPDGQEISWKKFETELLPSGRVAGLVVENKDVVRVYDRRATSGKADSTGFLRNCLSTQYFRIGSVDVFERNLDSTQRSLQIPLEKQLSVRYREETSWASTALEFAPTLLIIASWLFLMRVMGGGMGAGGGGRSSIFQIGKSPAKLYSPEKAIGVSFKDVAGLPEAKQEVMEFVDFLQNPGHFQKLGARIPRGALLVGPPGTGKTLVCGW
jgi:AFG3 family protein